MNIGFGSTPKGLKIDLEVIVVYQERLIGSIKVGSLPQDAQKFI